MGNCVLITHGVGANRFMMQHSFSRTWEWCKRHDIGFEGSTRREAPANNIYWDKIAMARRVALKVPDGTLIIWMDTDCMICNLDVDPRGVLPEDHFIGMRRVFCKENNKDWWNAGVIFMRNGPQLRAFLDVVWGLREDHKYNRTDEIVMNHVLETPLNKLLDEGTPVFKLPIMWNAMNRDEIGVIRGWHGWKHDRVIEKIIDEKSAVTRRIKIHRLATEYANNSGSEV